MQSTSSKMALKPYLEAMKAHCEGLSKDDLIKTLLHLAQEVPVGGRGDFLEKIRSVSHGTAPERSGIEKNIEERIRERIAALREAFEMGKDEASIGWSSGKAGILFSALLSVLSESSPKAVAIQTLLKEYAARSYSFSQGEGKEQEKVYSEIARGLAPIELNPSEREKYWAWAERIGRDRVERSVSAKHRRAYDRAARVLGALAECHVLSNAREKALSLLNEFLRVKFPRHHVFHTEVSRVVGGSVLVKALGAF